MSDTSLAPLFIFAFIIFIAFVLTHLEQQRKKSESSSLFDPLAQKQPVQQVVYKTTEQLVYETEWYLAEAKRLQAIQLRTIEAANLADAENLIRNRDALQRSIKPQ